MRTDSNQALKPIVLPKQRPQNLNNDEIEATPKERISKSSSNSRILRNLKHHRFNYAFNFAPSNSNSQLHSSFSKSFQWAQKCYLDHYKHHICVSASHKMCHHETSSNPLYHWKRVWIHLLICLHCLILVFYHVVHRRHST